MFQKVIQKTDKYKDKVDFLMRFCMRYLRPQALHMEQVHPVLCEIFLVPCEIRLVLHEILLVRCAVRPEATLAHVRGNPQIGEFWQTWKTLP